MADIVNPEAIQFCNEQIRPVAEKMRGLKAVIDSMMVDWFNGHNSVIGSSADDNIIDNRADASDLTAADVTALVAQAMAYQTALDAAGVAGIIALPCVRPLRVVDEG